MFSAGDTSCASFVEPLQTSCKALQTKCEELNAGTKEVYLPHPSAADTYGPYANFEECKARAFALSQLFGSLTYRQLADLHTTAPATIASSHPPERPPNVDATSKSSTADGENFFSGIADIQGNRAAEVATLDEKRTIVGFRRIKHCVGEEHADCQELPGIQDIYFLDANGNGKLDKEDVRLALHVFSESGSKYITSGRYMKGKPTAEDTAAYGEAFQRLVADGQRERREIKNLTLPGDMNCCFKSGNGSWNCQDIHSFNSQKQSSCDKEKGRFMTTEAGASMTLNSFGALKAFRLKNGERRDLSYKIGENFEFEITYRHFDL